MQNKNCRVSRCDLFCEGNACYSFLVIFSVQLNMHSSIFQLEVIDSNLNFPDVGSLEVGVDISPSCRVMTDDRTLASQGNEIADNLERFEDSEI